MSVPCPRGELRNRNDGGGAAARHASSDDNELLLGIGRQGAQGFFTAMLEDKGDGRAEVGEALLARGSLSVRAGNFRAIGDEPRPIALDDGCELVAHGFILTP